MYLSTSTLILLGFVLVGLKLIWQITDNLFFSPLRNVPGPLLARITPQWLIFIDLAGIRTSTIHNLHKKYGTAVRIAPTELSFSNPESVKDIYGYNTSFMKAPVYEKMSLPPLGIFSLTNKAAHAQRRRLLGHAFATSNVLDSEPLIAQIVHLLVEKVKQNIGKPLDMLLLFRLASLDIVGELFLGQSFGGLEAGVAPQFLHDTEAHFLLCAIEINFPWLFVLLSHLPISSVRHFFKSRERMGQYGQNAFEKYIAQHGRDSGRRDLLTKVLSTKPDTGDAELTDPEIWREVGNLISAGTDTTSTTLTYLFWELARNPVWQQRIRAELHDASPKTNAEHNPEFRELYTYQQIRDLPILDAVINEGLRLHPAAPGSLPRETPPSGRTLDGYHVPEKTIVSVQCYTTQRDPAAFPNPDIFLPERWLESSTSSSVPPLSAETAAAAKELFMPFSKGPRGCIGRLIATVELKLITAILVSQFEVREAEGTNAETMAMTDHMLVIPKANKCDLVFESITA